MQSTDHLNLPYLIASQAQKHTTHNEALRMLDALVQLSVLSRTNTTPPTNPQNGDRYIVPDNALEAWAQKSGYIAAFQDDEWHYYPPHMGWQSWIIADSMGAVWNGSQWQNIETPPSFNPIDGQLLGVNATADSHNRLALASPSSLFNHEGNSHQLKINKATPPDTASIIFQTTFSGHAEFGLTGDNDFHMKVSPDGATWHEGITIDKNSGTVSFPNTALASAIIATKTLTFGSGIYVPAPNVKSIKVTCIGGGGGGAGAYVENANIYCSAGGGGAGAIVIKYISATSLAANYSFNIGGNGPGGTATIGAPIGGRNGNAGGTTSFTDNAGLNLSANGGGGAPEDAAVAGPTEFLGGMGGTASGGDININGSRGFGGVTNGPKFAQNGVGNGANTLWGVGGAVNNGTNGAPGTGFGAGGAGACMVPGYEGALNRNGGNGAPGAIIIEEFS